MKKTLLCLLFWMPLVSCIFGGRDTVVEYQRFMVSLQSEQKHFCGGALVDIGITYPRDSKFRFVLTAASCVKDKQPHEIVVVGGITNLDDNNAIKCHVEQIFSKNSTGVNKVRNNIALLRLKEVISDRVGVFYPIRLKSDRKEDADDVIEEGKRCQFVGWGQKDRNAPEITNTLQEGRSEVQRLLACTWFSKDVDESNICTMGTEEGLCEFDTGDPLISYSNILWGIATEQHSCGRASMDVYTRVDSHYSWIRTTALLSASASTDHKGQLFVTGIVVLVMMSLN